MGGRSKAGGTPIARSLRLSLLAATMSVAVIAVLASAWVSNRESKRELVDVVSRDLEKVTLIASHFQARAEEFASFDDDPWAGQAHRSWVPGLDEFVRAQSEQYGLRIVVREETKGQVLADSGGNGGADLPPGSWQTIHPPPETADRELARLENYYTKLEDCYVDEGLHPTVAPDSPNGLRKPLIHLNAEKDDVAAGKAKALECQSEASDALEVRPPFPSMDLYVAEPAIARTVARVDGITGRSMLTIVAVIVLTILITAVVARKILRPIGRLTFAARRMADGDLSHRVQLRRSDELGQLADTFDAMAGTLEANAQQRKRMTTDIAHELRTPLSNIRGYLEAAQDGIAPLTPALVSSLLEDTLLLQGLVEDLQELSMAESGRLQLQRAPTDLDDLVGSVAAAHHARALQRGIAVYLDARTGLVVDVDARRVRQVVTNLIENAIRHTDAGGQIVVSAHRTEWGARIAVRDTGAGIEAAHLPHIFDRFYRTDASRNRATGGSGLGLAITRELVHAHGGTIDVSSVLGQGSTFVVDLPAAVDRPPATNGASAHGPSTNGAASPASVYSSGG
jgi:signal transduction histidine kinase